MDNIMLKQSGEISGDILMSTPSKSDCRRTLIVPNNIADYVIFSGNSALPIKVVLDNEIYHCLSTSPATAENKCGVHFGSCGTVGSYKSQRRNEVIVLKCMPTVVNGGTRRWFSELIVHEFMKKQRHRFAHSPSVDLLGFATARLPRCGKDAQSFAIFAFERMDCDLFTVISEGKLHGRPKDLVKILVSTAEQVAAMHKMGVVYNDLKPENILINLDTLQAKCADFDLSCISSIGLHSVGGTEGYICPERLLSDGDLFPAPEHDIWSFGVILLVALTRSGSPFSREMIERGDLNQFDAAEFIAKHVSDEWKGSPSLLNVMCNVTTSLLQPDPAKRPSLQAAIRRLRSQVTTNMDKGGSPRGINEQPCTETRKRLRSFTLASTPEEENVCRRRFHVRVHTTL